MNGNQIGNLIIILALTITSGLGDANGFTHAANMWEKGKFVYPQLFIALASFAIGIATYLVSIKYLEQFGIATPEMQTIGWLVVTTVGVAVISGKFVRWETFDQILSVVIIICLGILIFRTNG